MGSRSWLRSTASIACLLAFAVAESASASVIYTYTANNYTVIRDDAFDPGTYDTTMHISGTFELAAALPANLSFGPVTPLSFLFNDGRNSFSDTSPDLDTAIFEIETDAAANIKYWHILLIRAESAASVHRILQSDNTPSFVHEFGAIDLPGPVTQRDDGQNFDNPGIWVVTVPEPATVALVAAGLLGIGAARRRRTRSRRGAATGHG